MKMTLKQLRDMTKLCHQENDLGAAERCDRIGPPRKWPGCSREMWPNMVTKKMTWKQLIDLTKLGHQENSTETTCKCDQIGSLWKITWKQQIYVTKLGHQEMDLETADRSDEIESPRKCPRCSRKKWPNMVTKKRPGGKKSKLQNRSSCRYEENW